MLISVNLSYEELSSIFMLKIQIFNYYNFNAFAASTGPVAAPVSLPAATPAVPPGYSAFCL